MRGVDRASGRSIIALVLWAGGGHWVLVVDRDRRFGRASDYTVLDPSGNVVVNRGSSQYRAADGALGNFAGYYVMITGAEAVARVRVI